MSVEAKLVPPETKGRLSIARVTSGWYVACFSEELRRAPIARTILGIPIVLFRTERGEPGALLDRCPHRNVPLSLGTVVGEHLQCRYHGWQFDCGGTCRKVPGLEGKPEAKSRRTLSYAAREQGGCIWVFMSPDTEPTSEPFRFDLLDEPGYDTVRRRVAAQGTMHAVIENALDVPHTAFLHRGLFRGTSEPNEIEVVVRRQADRVEAEYIGEPRPTGLVGRILSPSGGVVTHYDRFILPCILQVEYRIGTENHVLVSAAATPIDDFYTALYAVVSFKLRLPHFLVKPLLIPIALRIFKQDAQILERQTEVIRRFGGEHFASTEIDVLGNHILRLLRQAERGEAVTTHGEVTERRLRLRA
jgi:phenylpropionate dioxygenase-like ring-hydroxylating dioxygenase large terminal subunit